MILVVVVRNVPLLRFRIDAVTVSVLPTLN